MLNVTDPQATIIAALIVAVLGGMASQMFGGLGFVLRRWITGAPHNEALDRASKVTDMLAKMREHGLGDAELQQWGVLLRKPEFAASPSVAEVLEQSAGEPQAYHSNAAMKGRTGAAYDVAQAKLEQALLDLVLLLEPREAEALDRAQQLWAAYRDGLQVFASEQFHGGTHAPLAGLLAGLAETERRTSELVQQSRELGAR